MVLAAQDYIIRILLENVLTFDRSISVSANICQLTFWMNKIHFEMTILQVRISNQICPQHVSLLNEDMERGLQVCSPLHMWGNLWFHGFNWTIRYSHPNNLQTNQHSVQCFCAYTLTASYFSVVIMCCYFTYFLVTQRLIWGWITEIKINRITAIWPGQGMW